MNFETYVDRNLENGMQEELCEKIGDLVTNQDVNLEELCNHSLKTLKHLYRLMVENTGLEMKNVDDMAVYFTHLECGHEFYLPWQNVVDDVTQMVKDNDMVVRCRYCKPQQKIEAPKQRGDKKVSKKIKQSDLDNAQRLEFKFLEPIDRLPNDRKVKAVRLSSKIKHVILPHYKKACKEKNMVQVKNTGQRLQAAVNELRKDTGDKCAVKLATPEGN